MSWLFSRALVEECLARNNLGCEQSALLSWIGNADAFLCSDKMSVTYEVFSQFGMTFVPLTADRGATQLISSLGVFLAKLSAQRHAAETTLSIYGQKWLELSPSQLRNSCLPKTSCQEQLNKPQTIAPRWVTKPKCFPLARQTWVQITFGTDIGYLHTPTTKANYAAPSMQKHPGCKTYVKVFGKPHPVYQEWLMAWPEGWTDLKPLATDKFQSWQRRLCGHLQMLSLGESREA